MKYVVMYEEGDRLVKDSEYRSRKKAWKRIQELRAQGKNADYVIM